MPETAGALIPSTQDFRMQPLRTRAIAGMGVAFGGGSPVDKQRHASWVPNLSIAMPPLPVLSFWPVSFIHLET